MARILHVVLSLGHGGAERLVIELCDRLGGEFDFGVCCLDEPGAWADQLRGTGVSVTALGRHPGFHPSLAFQIAAEARRVGARVLHCHEYSPFVYGTLAQTASPGLKILATEHGRLSTERAPIKRRLATRLLTVLPATVVAVCGELRERLIDEGFPAHRVQVLLNGTNPGPAPSSDQRAHARSVLHLTDTEFVVGAVGRLVPVKAFGTLLGAMSALRQNGVKARLMIVGEGPERAELDSRVRALDLGGLVHLIGHRDDARELMPAFDVFASSSVYEGVSLTILEAMAAVRPVVATRVGGTPEVVDDGVTGLLVPPGAPDSMAHAIGALAIDPDARIRYGTAGRARILESFTLDGMAQRYARLYRDLGAA